MAAPSEGPHRKSAADLLRWLEMEVAPRLAVETEVIAHGGTALTLLGIKASTKDVDFTFRTREAFERFATALEASGFVLRGDFRPLPAEVYRRFENPGSSVDVVDLRYPVWNNWRWTKKALEKALVLRLGTVRLVRPDRDLVFLFKTYPLRATDLDDLRSFLEGEAPDEVRVMQLFEDQDRALRSELSRDDTELEPLFLLLDLRFRFAASMELLGTRYRKRIPRIARMAGAKFRELRLEWSLPRLIAESKSEDRVLSWDRVLGRQQEPLRRRLERD